MEREKASPPVRSAGITYVELAERLGVEPNEGGGISTLDLANGCMHVMNSDQVLRLSPNDRNETFEAAADFLDEMFSGGLE